MNAILNKTQTCTTIEQSKELLEIYHLKPETADMCYYKPYPNELYELTVREPYFSDDIPAWSLHRLIMLRDLGMKEHNGDNRSRLTEIDPDKIYYKVISEIKQLIDRGYLKFYTSC